MTTNNGTATRSSRIFTPGRQDLPPPAAVHRGRQPRQPQPPEGARLAGPQPPHHPTSGSWPNMLKIFFSIITQEIRYGSHASVAETTPPSIPSSRNGATASSGPKPQKTHSPRAHDSSWTVPRSDQRHPLHAPGVRPILQLRSGRIRASPTPAHRAPCPRRSTIHPESPDIRRRERLGGTLHEYQHVSWPARTKFFGSGRKLTTTITPATPLDDHGAPRKFTKSGTILVASRPPLLSSCDHR
jgi:hypothetical protein